MSSGIVSSSSLRSRVCLNPSLILILRAFLVGFLGLASFFGRWRRLFLAGGALVGFWGGGAFFGGAFFGGGGGGGAFLFAGGAFFGGGGGGGGGAFLPFFGGGATGGGGFFAIPNAPCKQRVPLKKSGK